MPVNIDHSTAGTTTLAAPSSGTTTLTLPSTTGTIVGTDSNSNATITGTYVMGSSFLRNRVINGDMRIDQRNSGASVSMSSGTSTYSVDRWQGIYSQTTKFTLQQNAAAVTPPAGFPNYLGATSTSSYTILTGDYFGIQQFIEGYNTSDLDFGLSTAQTVTLSFWVRSSLTGTFNVSLRNVVPDRSYVATYTVNAANTWEKKSVTVPGPTASGTWNTTNSTGIAVWFSLGIGSTYTTSSPNTWLSGNYAHSTGANSIVAVSGATLYITGVQLEVGTIATPFERQLWNNQLAQCQRYYIAGTSIWVGTSAARSTAFTVPMRATPTIAGGGTGFTIANQTSSTAVIYQTTAAAQTLSFSIEL